MGNRKLTDINTRLAGIGDSIATTKAALIILDKELGTDKQEHDKAVGVALPLAIAKLRQLLLRIENFTTLRQQAFSEAFDAVNLNFQDIFAELSDGDEYKDLDAEFVRVGGSLPLGTA